MREVGLIYVAGRNVVVSMPHAIPIGRSRLLRSEQKRFELPYFTVFTVLPRGAGEPGLPFGQSVEAFAVQFVAGFTKKSVRRRAENKLNPVAPVINGRDEVIQRKVHVRQGQVVNSYRWQGFETADEIIAEAADGSAKEWRQVTGMGDHGRGDSFPER